VLTTSCGRVGQPTPKEQPPRESLRHTDRKKLALWKEGLLALTEGENRTAANLSGSETDGARK